MRRILPFFLLSIVLGCSKSGNITPASQLVGTWRLATYCKSINGSACTMIEVPSNKNVYVSFDRGGKFDEAYENTRPVEYGFLGCGGGSYTMEGDNIRIVALCMSSLSGRLMKLVSIDDKRLVLDPFGTGDYIFVRK